MKHPPLLLPLTAVPLRPGTDVLFGEQVPKKRWKMPCLGKNPCLPSKE